jgi:hypothetical protein
MARERAILTSIRFLLLVFVPDPWIAYLHEPMRTNDDILLMEGAHITMHVRPSERLMLQTWRGFVPSGTFRSIMDRALVHAKRLDVQRWFNDLRKMEAILQKDEKWTMEDWFPRLAMTNVSRMAFLMSSDYFNQRSVDRIMQVGTEMMPLSVGYFDDAEEARSWLLSSEPAMEPV